MKIKYKMPPIADLQPKDSVVYSYVQKIVDDLNKSYNVKPKLSWDYSVIYSLLMHALQETSYDSKRTLFEEALHNFKKINRNETLNRSTLVVVGLAHKKKFISKMINDRKIEAQDDLLAILKDAMKTNQTLIDTLIFMIAEQVDG